MHSTFAKLGKDLVRAKNLTNHRQVLSMASVDLAEARLEL
jgi:hypothetical protein